MEPGWAAELLEEYGWTMECWSPFEIRKGESFATNEAAGLILGLLEEDRNIKAKRKKVRQQKKKKGKS